MISTKQSRAVMSALMLSAFLAGCGPSKEEAALKEQVAALTTKSNALAEKQAALETRAKSAEVARDESLAKNAELVKQLAPYLAAEEAKKVAAAETAKLPSVATALRGFMTLPKLDAGLLAYRDSTHGARPLSGNQVYERLQKWADTYVEPKEKAPAVEVPKENLRWVGSVPASAGSAERNYFLSHKKMFEGFYARLDGTPTDHYLVSDPFILAESKGEKTIVIGGSLSDSILNTLRLDERARAKKMLVSQVLPIVRTINVSFEQGDVQKWAWVHIFYAKSFSGDETEKPEVVCIVSSFANSKRFLNGEATEDEFIAQSDIFISPLDADTELKKVNL